MLTEQQKQMNGNMSRNILELKKICIPSVKVETLKVASQVSELKGFDLKVSFFETVSSPIDYVKDFSFYEMGDTYEANVPVNKIKGTTHESYLGKNWLVMMMSLKRHTEDFDVERVVHAIQDRTVTERIRLSKYGDDYFIDGGGNHRVCQAKLLELDSVPCEVTEYVFNDVAYRKAQRLWAIKEIDPPFVYHSYNDESLISLCILGLQLYLHFCDHEIDILENVLQKAKVESKNPIKMFLSKVCLKNCDNYYNLSRKECIEPLSKALTVRLKHER